MTRVSTSFVRDRELIIVEAEVVGRAGRTTGARLVLDTGAAATTLTPNVIQAVGYSRRDAYKESTVHTAIGEERGYWIHVAEFTVLDVTTPDFAVTVFGWDFGDIDGLVMNCSGHRFRIGRRADLPGN
ncbi:MAG: retroviral-like aspartic protease family protein [Myxococcales bacterium]|nr:retroviral-like aspartic protease family protein [Myxococcales bacterium]